MESSPHTWRWRFARKGKYNRLGLDGAADLRLLFRQRGLVDDDARRILAAFDVAVDLNDEVRIILGPDCVRRPMEDEVLWNLQLETLRKAVDGLGDPGRDLVELRYGRGLTMEEIGTIYGVSKAAVSKRLKKFHEQLRGSVK